MIDESVGREFLKHEYNRDGDSYRSPWTNTYHPASPDCTFYPSPALLEMEKKANDLFADYVKAYYDYALSSVYFVDTETPGFNATFLVKRELRSEKDIKYGCWDAIHVVTCNLKNAPKADYRVISTVMITLEAQTQAIGEFSMAGSCAKTKEESLSIPADL